MGTVIGGLLLPRFETGDYGRAMNQGILGGAQLVQGQTQLLALQEQQRQQASAANYRQALAANPDILLTPGGGGSTLASLNAGGPPGAITQGPLPGMPGQTQTIGAPQDLSQFATGQPPQSTIAGLAPAPPQDPVRALMQRDPEAGLQLLDMRAKMQERTLGIQEKKMAYFGQLLQGATDQASWDQAREQVGRVDPQAASRMPPLFNKDVRDQMVQQALSVQERLTLQIAEGKNQLDAAKLRLQAANIPNYTGDAQLDALIYTQMKDQPPGTMPSQAIVEKAIQQREADKLKVSERQGIAAAEIERTEKPLESTAAKAVSDLTLLRTMTDDVVALYKDAYSGPVVGRSGYLREQGGFMDPEETAFRSTLKNVNDILGRLRSGANIPAPEMANLERLAPNANDPPATFRAKMQSFQRALEQQRESITRVGTTGRQQLREETRPTTPRVGSQSTSQAPAPQAPAGGKTLSQAGLAALAERRKMSVAEVRALAEKNGYRIVD